MNWLSFCALILLAGGLSAQSVLPSSKVIKYRYNTTIATGIPDGASQYAMFTLESKLQVTTMGNEFVYFKMDDIRGGEKNDVFPDLDIKFVDIRKQGNYAFEKLKLPFGAKFSDGLVTETHFEAEDDIQSKDLKKAIIDLYQMQKGGRYQRLPNDLPRQGGSGSTAKFYRSREQSILGICEVQNVEEFLPDPSNPRAKVLNVTKFVNSENCNMTPEFLLTNHAPFRCTDCDSNKAFPFSHNIITKFGIKVQDKDYLIEQIYREGVMRVSPAGTEGDSLYSIYNQWLTLEQMQASNTQGPQLKSPKQETIVSNMKEQMRKVYDPTANPPSREIVQSITSQVERLLGEIESLSRNKADSKSVKKILDNEALIQKGLRALPRDELKKLVEKFAGSSSGSRRSSDRDGGDEGGVKGKLILDMLARTGTKGAIEVIAKLIEERKVEDKIRIASMLQNIAPNALVPDTQIVDTMLNLCSNSRRIQESDFLRKTCYLNFASLVATTCIRYSSRTVRPLPADRHCSRDKLRSWVAHLQQKAEEAKDNEHEDLEAAFTTAIGIMGAQDGIRALESRVLRLGTDSDLVQITSIYAMRLLAKMFPDEALDPLFAVLYNSKARSEARIAATAVILGSHPSKERIQELATYTWIVDDQQVGAFIFSSLQALSNATLSCHGELANNARHALAIANNEVKDSAFMGHRSVIDNMMDHLEAGYAIHTAFVGESGSGVPSGIHFRLQNYLAGYLNNIVEIGAHGIELKDVIDKLVGPAYMFKEDGVSRILKNLNRDIPDMGLNFINEKLGIKPRTSEESRALVMVRLLHQKISQFYLNASQVAEFFDREFDFSNMKNLEGRFDWQTSLNPLDIKFVTPSASGFHLHLNVKLPVFVSARGEYSAKVSAESERADAKMSIKFNVEPQVAAKVNVEFGPVVPCRPTSDCPAAKDVRTYGPTWGVHFAAGFENTVILRPFTSLALEGQFNRRDKTVKFEVSSAGGSDSSRKEFIYYETKPYTVIHPRYQLKPIAEFSKPMRVMERPFKVEHDWKHANLALKGNHEDEWLDRANIMGEFHERGVFGMINFALLTQKLRMREISLQMQGGSSSSSKYTFNLSWDFKPAQSDARYQISNVRQGIWSALSGWTNVPEECSDVSSSSSKPWEYQHQKVREMYRSHHSSSMGFSDRGHNSESNESSEETAKWENRSRMMKPYSKESESTEDSSESFRQDSREQSRERDHSWRGKSGSSHKLQVETKPLGRGTAVLSLKGSVGARDSNWNFECTMSSERETLMKKLEVSVTKRGGSGSFNGNVKAFIKHPKRACYFGAKLADELEKKITGNAEVSWQDGSSSSKMKFDITAKKSEEQKNLDRQSPTDSRKPWFYEECERNRQRGFLNCEACQQVMDHKAELHEFRVDADFTGVRPSTATRKVAIKAQKLLMHLFYNHMTEDLDDVASSGKASVIMKFNYSMPVFNLIVKTPREKTMFENVFFGQHMPWWSAPSTRKGLGKKIAEHITNRQAPATCLGSGRFINTFDNNTLNLANAGNCPYLVAKDCSTGNSFYVMQKHNSNKENDKTLIVGILQHTIQISPRESSSQKDIVIDGEAQKASNRVILQVNDPALKGSTLAIITKTEPLYHVVLPFLGIRIKFDGNNLKIEASTLWRNKLCGMCGEFRGRQIYDLIGPEQCAHANERDLLGQFTVQEGSCRGAQKTNTKLCDVDTSRASATTRDKCTVNRNYNVRGSGGRVTCFTVGTHSKCADDCRAASEEEKTVEAYCVKVGDERAEAWVRESRVRPVTEIMKKSPNANIKIKVPSRCIP